jgi:sugar phosphate isomerase/epimerase
MTAPAFPAAGRLSWSSATHPHTTMQDELDIAARLGLDGLGLNMAKVDASGMSDEKLRAELKARGLRATLCGPMPFSILAGPRAFGGSKHFAQAVVDRSPAERVSLICQALPRLAEFDPVGVVIAPGNSGDPDIPAGPLDIVADGLATIADAAAAAGVRVAFELLGQRRGSPLYTLPDIVRFIDAVGRDNVDVLFDVFHSWPEPDLHEHLVEYVDRIVSVDLCDIKVAERSGFDREFPGHGRAVTPAIIATLIKAGYQGWWNLEVFSDDGTFGHEFADSYWKLPVDEYADRLLTTTKDAFATAEKLLG